MPNLDAVNKFALDVIRVQVNDYVAELDENDEGNFDVLRDKFINALGRRAQDPRSKTLPTM